MSASEKLIIGAVSLIITGLLIGIGFKIFNRTENISNAVMEEQDKVIQTEREYNMVKYDGYDIPGSTAINYVKTVVTDYDISVTLVKGAKTVMISKTEQFSGLRKVDSEYYINPLKEYSCEVVYDVNDAVSGVILSEIP